MKRIADFLNRLYIEYLENQKIALIVVLLITLLAFGLRVYFLYSYPPPQLKYDATVYYSMAKKIAFNEGTNIGFDRYPPGYPLFLALILLAFGKNIFIVRLIQILLSSFLIPIVYLIASSTYNRRTGIIASLSAAIYLSFIYSSVHILSDTLFIFLFYLCVLFFIESLKKDKIVYDYLTWIFMGLMILTRRVVILFPAVILIFIFVFKGINRRLIKRLIPFALIFLLFFGFLVFFSYKYTNQLFPVYLEKSIGVLEAGTPKAVEKLYKQDKLTDKPGIKKTNMKDYNVTNKIVYYLKFIWLKIERIWTYPYNDEDVSWLLSSGRLIQFHRFLLLFVLAGLVISFRHYRNNTFYFLLAIIIYFFTILLMGIPIPRYNLPAIPALLILSSPAINQLIEGILRKIRKIGFFMPIFLFIGVIVLLRLINKEGALSTIDYRMLYTINLVLQILLVLLSLFIMLIIFWNRKEKIYSFFLTVLFLLPFIYIGLNIYQIKPMELICPITNPNIIVQRKIKLPEERKDIEKASVVFNVRAWKRNNFGLNIKANGLMIKTIYSNSLKLKQFQDVNISLDKDFLKQKKQLEIDIQGFGDLNRIGNFFEIPIEENLNNNSYFFNGSQWSDKDLSLYPGKQSGGYNIKLMIEYIDGRKVCL